jgi:serine/threonine protein kinase
MTSHCSIGRLESALAGNLPADDEASLHRHLESCDRCSAALERMAGGPAWRQEVASLLIGDELDAAVPARQEWSDVDFTVEHLEPSGEPNVLGRLGGYDVLEILGRGGMGVVLKAYDRELKRCMAIKVLAPHLAHSSLARKRFAREAQAAAAVVNPHVIAIHQVQPNGRLPFLVMPLIAGKSLAQRLSTRGTLELKEILRIGMQAADGLAAAHEQGLVHRDVKPANVLLEKGVERAVLTDFGLARAADDIAMTGWGIVAGTPEYMSPEQARGEPLDGRSDLFSLGCVLYEMATGVSPFRADSMMATMRRLVDDAPRAMGSLNPELPPWFVGIVDRLLEKDPSRRFASAKEVSDLLAECLAHVQQPNVVPLPLRTRPPASPASKPQRRSPVFKLLLGAAFAFTMIFAGIVILLELNKGTLTIESDADNVPVQINQGDKVVEKLTISRTGASVRIAAGRYEIELLTEADGLVIKNGTFTLIRGKEHVVTIKRLEASAFQAPSVRGPEPDKTPLWNAFGFIPAPVSPLTAKVLEWIGLHLHPITKDRFRDKNVFTKYQGGLDVTFVRTDGPVEKAGIHEVDIVVRLQGRPIASLEDLDVAMQNAVEQIERGDANSLQFDVLRSGETVRVNVPFPVSHLDPLRPGLNSDSTSLAQPAESKPKTSNAVPQRVHHFQTGAKVKTVACSTDGKLIAIANGNPTFILQTNGRSRVKDNWKPSAETLEAETGKTVVVLQLTTKDEDTLLAATERVPDFEVTALAFSPDGNVVAVGTTVGQVKLFNARTGELVRSLDDKQAKLADKKTPEKLKSLTRAMGSVASLAFSPDGSLLAMCGSSFGDSPLVFDRIQRLGHKVTGPGRLKLWEVKTGSLKHDLVGHSDSNAVSFSPDGNLLASAGRWSGREFGTGVIIWNPQTGAKSRTFPTEANGGTWSVAFSPNSKLVAIGSLNFDKDKDKDASTWAVSLTRVGSGIMEWQQTIPRGTKPAAFSPDGKSVAVLCGGQSIRFFETETGKVKHEIRSTDFPQSGRWNDFAITPHKLAIGGIDAEKRGFVELWDLGSVSSDPLESSPKKFESTIGVRH